MHQLPSRSHLSCLAVCKTQSFLLIPHCQEGADGRCALPIILFLWYPACWQNSGRNIWRQEFAVYFQFWVTELKDNTGYRKRRKGLYWIGADRFLWQKKVILTKKEYLICSYGKTKWIHYETMYSHPYGIQILDSVFASKSCFLNCLRPVTES